MTEIRLANPTDLALILASGDQVFDHAPRADLTEEVLSDPRHHLAIAIADGLIGFASAVHYVHPDKPPQLWINELGVIDSHRRRGVATSLIRCLCDQALALGCTEAWVIADQTEMAHGFYRSLGAEQCGTSLAMFTIPLPRETAQSNGAH